MIRFPANYEHIDLWDNHYGELGYVRFRTEIIKGRYYLTYKKEE